VQDLRTSRCSMSRRAQRTTRTPTKLARTTSFRRTEVDRGSWLPLRPAPTTEPMRARKGGGAGRRHKPSETSHPAEPERLQKLLARAGLASRREAEEWIRAGRITVNGELATLGVRAGPADDIRLHGRVVRQRASSGTDAVFICHRSPGENLRQPVTTETEGESSAHSSARRALTDR